MDAQRDIKADLSDRSSFWGKMVSDIGLDENQLKQIEGNLNDINNQIINDSKTLKHIQGRLDKLNRTVSGSDDGVKIHPLTRKIRDLSKGMNIYFKDKESESFPIENHGMGTRSWATLLTLDAYISWKADERLKQGKPFYPILALEEPEAHLHPQAQRQVYNQLKAIPGQKIISTHSPYIAGVAKLESLRHFYKPADSTVVNNIGKIDPEDKRKIEKEIINTNGELLFADALVFCEGYTEEHALPIFAKKYWGRHPFEFGINFISTSGGGNYLPFLKFAKAFNIKWFIFSDGELKITKKLKKDLESLGYELEEMDNVVVLDNDNNFESYLIQEEYQNELNKTIKQFNVNNGKNESHQKSIIESFKSYDDENLKIVLKAGKTKYSKLIAENISNLDDRGKRFPPAIRKLFEVISKEMNINIAQENKKL